MDGSFLTDILECSVCLEQLDSSSKVLPCQHTFCKRCLEEIVFSQGDLRCPECRVLVKVGVDDLPCNILLNRLLEGIKNNTQMRNNGAGVISPPPMESSTVSQPKSENKETDSQPVSPQYGGGPAFPNALTPSGSGEVRTAPKLVSKRQESTPALPQPEVPNQSQLIQPTDKRPTVKQAMYQFPCAIALCSYEAQVPGDLSLKKGDLVMLRKRVNQNWYHGDVNGKGGLVLASLLQVISPLPGQIPQCKALYDFSLSDNNDKDCLSFSKGDVITVIRQVDENWAEGKLGEGIGIFPISFVELNNAARVQLKANASNRQNQSFPVIYFVPPPPTTNQDSSSTSSPSSPGSLSSPPPPSHVSPTSAPAIPRNNCPRLTKPQPPETSTPSSPITTTEVTSSPFQWVDSAGPRVSRRQRDKELTGSPSNSSQVTETGSYDSSSPVYLALYNYKPNKDDELELKKGELYTVSEKCQDGWFKGTSLRMSRSGVFPGNYVQIAKSPPPSLRPPGPTKCSIPNSVPCTPSRPKPNHFKPPVTRPTSTSPTSCVGPYFSSDVLEWLPPGPLRSTQPPPTSQPQSTLNNPWDSNNPWTNMWQGGEGASCYPSNTGGRPEPQTPTTTSSSLTSSTPPSAAAISTPTPQPQSQVPSKADKPKDRKERLSLVKRLTKHSSPFNSSALPFNVVHVRSGSCPSEALAGNNPSHKKSLSIDSSAARPKQPPPLVRERFRCIVPYPPNSEYELELKVGDLVYVHKKRDDGWFKGTLQRTGKTGLFPASFVESF